MTGTMKYNAQIVKALSLFKAMQNGLLVQMTKILKPCCTRRQIIYVTIKIKHTMRKKVVRKPIKKDAEHFEFEYQGEKILVEHNHVDTEAPQRGKIAALLAQAFQHLYVGTAVFIPYTISSPNSIGAAVRKKIKDEDLDMYCVTRKVTDKDGMVIGSRIIRKK